MQRSRGLPDRSFLFCGTRGLGTFTATFTGSVGISPNRFRCFAAEKSRLLPVGRLAEQRKYRHTFRNSVVEGTVSAPSNFTGTVFVGLYPTRVPQGFPVAGTKTITPGHYRIERVPQGTYYLLAAAVNGSEGGRHLLVPGERSLYVAHAGPMSMLLGGLSVHWDLVLRKIDFADPPVLVALPLLRVFPTPNEFESTPLPLAQASDSADSWDRHINSRTEAILKGN